MPKVLIVIARLNVGGTAQYIGELVQGLRTSGYEILLATGHVQGAEEFHTQTFATLEPIHLCIAQFPQR